MDSEIAKAIYAVLNDWNLNCSEDDVLKQELAQQIEQAVINLTEPSINKRYCMECGCNRITPKDLGTILDYPIVDSDNP